MPLHLGQRYGKTANNFSSFDFSGANTQNEVGTDAGAGVVKLPQCAHRIYKLSAFFAGDGAAVVARMDAWWQSAVFIPAYQLIKHSASFTAPAGSHAIGGQTLNSVYADSLGGLSFAGAGNVIIGWWRTEAATSVWSVLATGNFIATAAADDSNISAGVNNAGDIQAYVDLVGGDIKSLQYGFPAFTAGRTSTPFSP
jgi:hypothetical protein